MTVGGEVIVGLAKRARDGVTIGIGVGEAVEKMSIGSSKALKSPREDLIAANRKYGIRT